MAQKETPDQIMAHFRRETGALEIPIPEAEQIYSDLLDLGLKYREARQMAASLRPTSGNYETEMAALSGRWKALEIQVADAHKELLVEMERVKSRTVSNGFHERVLEKARAVSDEIDTGIAQTFKNFWRLMEQRHVAEAKLSEQSAILNAWLDQHGHSYNLQGGYPWGGSVPVELQVHARRILERVVENLSKFGPPIDGDWLAWLRNRRK